MTTNNSLPAMSVVLVTERLESLSKVLAHLRAQTACRRLEIVIVLPATKPATIEAADDFFRVCWVGWEQFESQAAARAAGVLASSAPIVAFGETHSYPAPGWAEALIERHREDWSVVGPAVGNANPTSTVSWSNLLIDYGDWIAPQNGGSVGKLPGHNSAYKRAVLLDCAGNLESMLEAEVVLHWDLRAKGHQLYLEPRAKTLHLNVSAPSAWLPERFFAGRLFAAARARRWHAWKRWLYVAGAPLIPLIRFGRILRAMLRSRHQNLIPRVIPALVMGLVVSALGEVTGYAFGRGDPRALSEIELDREAFLARTDPARRRH